MIKNFCPACGEQLTSESINLAEGVALCPSCGGLSRLSEVVDQDQPVSEILNETPKGCSVSESGENIVVQASLRSAGGFFGSLFVALFWNGIVSVFVLIALSGLYTNFIGPLPYWFPAPNNEETMPLGMTLFLCVFLLPFVGVGAGMVSAMLLNLSGKIKVIIGDNDASVGTGVGFLTWRRKFDPTRVRRVSGGTTSWQTNGKSRETIVIEADRTVKFGSLLRDDRREWLQAVLRGLLVDPKPGQRGKILAQIGDGKTRY